MDIGWPIEIFMCVGLVIFKPIGFDMGTRQYQPDLELWKSVTEQEIRHPLVLLGVSRQCVVSCVCG